jgi:hypothetical protein
MPQLLDESLRRLQKAASKLGSPYVGQRALGALDAAVVLREYGLTWEDLFAAAFGPADTPSEDPEVAGRRSPKSPEVMKR